MMKQKFVIVYAHHVVPEPQRPMIFRKSTFALDWMVAVDLQQNSEKITITMEKSLLESWLESWYWYYANKEITVELRF